MVARQNNGPVGNMVTAHLQRLILLENHHSKSTSEIQAPAAVGCTVVDHNWCLQDLLPSGGCKPVPV